MCFGKSLLYLLCWDSLCFLYLWIHIFHHSWKIHILVRIPKGMNRENQERQMNDVAIVRASSQLNLILLDEYIITFLFYEL